MGKKFSGLDILAILGALLIAIGGVSFAGMMIFSVLNRPELGSPEFRVKEDHTPPLIAWLIFGVGILTLGIAKSLGAKVFKTEMDVQAETLEELKKINNLETNNAVKIRCRSCKTINDEDASFCKKCGKSMS